MEPVSVFFPPSSQGDSVSEAGAPNAIVAVVRGARWTGFTLAAFGVALSVASASAQDANRAEAERAFAAGEQAFAAGQNLAAARAFENAYDLTPLPEITFSIAQAYRRHYFEDPDVQWLEKAQSLYRRYLDEEPVGGRRAHAITHLSNIAVLLSEAQRGDAPTPASPTPLPTELLISSSTAEAHASVDGGTAQKVPVVEKVTPGPHRVKVRAPGHFDAELEVLALEGRLIIVPMDLKPQPGRLRVATDPNAEVWVDGRILPRSLATAGISLPAGLHTVSVTASGRRSASKSINIERAGDHALTVPLQTSPQRIAAYWLFAGAGALALAGGAMTVLAAVSESQAHDARAGLQEGRAMTPDEADRFNAALARRDLSRGLAIGGFGGGALLGLTATFVFVFDNPIPDTQDAGTAYGLKVSGSF